MPYRQYAIHFRPSARCACCGARVRMRGFAVVSISSVAALLISIAVFLRVEDFGLLMLFLACLAVFGLIADIWTYRNLTWDPVGEEPSS